MHVTSQARLRASLPVIATVAATLSCTSVPSEVVSLSSAVEERIVATQVSHEAFVSQYFAASRTRIEDFLQYRWIPAFLEDYVRRADLMTQLAQPAALDSLDTVQLRSELERLPIRGPQQTDVVGAVNRALGDAKRGETVLLFAEAGFEEIARQRRELLDPIDRQEETALEQLLANYAELLSMQKTVTEFLTSIREVKEMEESVLKQLKLQEERDRIVHGAIDLNDDIAKILTKGEKASETIEQLKDLLEGR